MKFICSNGKIVADTEPALAKDNRAFRYGDGLFETMKMINGRIILKEFHFDRLFSSVEILKYKIPALFTPSQLVNEINELTEKNQCSDLCRIRLTIFRGNGNLKPSPGNLNYIIECISLNPSVNVLNEKGFSIDIYRNSVKSCDMLANIKSASFLPYVMGSIYAEENKLDDAVLLNTKGMIADTTIANIFLVKEKKLFTPALSEGCINGVMRRYLLEKLREKNYVCTETEIKEDDLLNADEVFLTNAITGIRWVKNYEGKQYKSAITEKIYNEFIQTIFL
ncbi:MAG: aminotransferase class IV [Bacteroidota bacterium]